MIFCSAFAFAGAAEMDRFPTNGVIWMDLNALTGLFAENSGSVVLNVLLSVALIWAIRQIAGKEKVIQNYQKRDEENEKQLSEYNRSLVKLLIEREALVRESADKTKGEEVVNK
ncbi:hypothetical protein R70723_04945 [Paenibacillus sp. FSL R7-0273]|nr:hypothetical protein R70723_04945 [Paenibacillus sp. FSL R7-0273]